MATIEVEAEQIYNLDLNGAQLVYIVNLISKQPYFEAEPIMSNIATQVNNQINK